MVTIARSRHWCAVWILMEMPHLRFRIFKLSCKIFGTTSDAGRNIGKFLFLSSLFILLLLLLLYDMDYLITGLFFLVLLLNQRWFSSLRLQGSHCSTLRIMCDFPSIAAFCSESKECFPGTAFKFSLKLLVTLPVASITAVIIVRFRFHLRCISIDQLLYFNFFPASFCTPFLSAGIATSISVHVFSFLS